ncbi:sodium/proline symporter [Rickettsiales bacterium LUAb2]
MSNYYYYIIIIALYVISLYIISYFAQKRNKTHDDYIISGRRNGSLNAAISAGASDMSGWLLLGLPGAVYTFGINQAWIAIGLTVGAYFNWRIVAPRLRNMSEKCNTATLPDFFSVCVGNNTSAIRILSGIMILIFFTVYVASCFAAGAKVFNGYFHISYDSALVITFLIISIYTAIGGLLAINWTDLLNGTIILVVMLGLPILVYVLMKSNHVHVLDNALAFNSHSTSLFYNTSLLQIISLLGWGLGYFGQPHILNQFMAMRDHTLAKRARIIGISWMALGLGFAIIVGFLGSAYFLHTPLSDPETVMIKLSAEFTPIFTALVLVAILAAVMSTAAAQLLIISTVFTNDLKIIKKSITMNKILVLVIGLVSLYIASNPNSKVLGMVSYAWAGFGACFGPLMLASLLTKNLITKQGAFTGILVGGITVILWKYLQGLNIATFFSLYEIIPGFIFSGLAIYIVSFITRKSKSNTITTA